LAALGRLPEITAFSRTLPHADEFFLAGLVSAAQRSELRFQHRTPPSGIDLTLGLLLEASVAVKVERDLPRLG
jgi:hypothetical protein